MAKYQKDKKPFFAFFSQQKIKNRHPPIDF